MDLLEEDLVSQTSWGTLIIFLHDPMRKEFVKMCNLNFSQATDSVYHKMLVQKNQSFGIGGSVLNLVSDFPKNRSATPDFGSNSSEEMGASSGAPQASVFGPPVSLSRATDFDVRKELKCPISEDDLRFVRTGDHQGLLREIKMFLISLQRETCH